MNFSFIFFQVIISFFSVAKPLLQGVEFSNPDLQAFETFFFRFELWQETDSIPLWLCVVFTANMFGPTPYWLSEGNTACVPKIRNNMKKQKPLLRPGHAHLTDSTCAHEAKRDFQRHPRGDMGLCPCPVVARVIISHTCSTRFLDFRSIVTYHAETCLL